MCGGYWVIWIARQRLDSTFGQGVRPFKWSWKRRTKPRTDVSPYSRAVFRPNPAARPSTTGDPRSPSVECGAVVEGASWLRHRRCGAGKLDQGGQIRDMNTRCSATLINSRAVAVFRERVVSSVCRIPRRRSSLILAVPRRASTRMPRISRACPCSNFLSWTDNPRVCERDLKTWRVFSASPLVAPKKSSR